jgi:hypothetical protein
MSLSNDRGRPKSLRFVDVTVEERPPGWLGLRADEPHRVGPGERVDRLVPPEVPSHERPALAPVLDSVRPPPPRPSHFPRPTPYPGTAHPGSQYPAAQFGSQYPSSPPGSPSQYPNTVEGLEPFARGPAEHRSDTMVEDLVPRAEEEAVAAIATAVERFQRDREQSLASAERELVGLVQAICRRVLLAELQLNPLVIVRLVQAGLEALASGDKLSVRLGPFFADAAANIQDSLEQRGVNALVVIDASVGAQGCVLSTELGRVDESVSARLDVVLASLGLSD